MAESVTQNLGCAAASSGKRAGDGPVCLNQVWQVADKPGPASLPGPAEQKTEAGEEEIQYAQINNGGTGQTTVTAI